jgi:5-formyltetrahydrofolate cyclo-ligase
MDDWANWVHAGKITSMESLESKSEIRQRAISMRPQSSAGLAANLVRLAMELDVKVIASYHPLGNEPDVSDFNAWALAMGKTLLLPKIVGEDLEFATGELSSGSHGISEPNGPSMDIAAADLILLPALAVDAAGNRVGKGKGFYDRALSEVTGIPKYAVVFDSEVLPAIAAEDHDVWVTGAVTPTAIHHFRASAIS